MPGKSSAAEMPRLDAFDQEFGREPVAIARGHRRKIRLKVWVLIVVLLAAGVISALALGWPNGEGLLRLDTAALFQSSAGREDQEAQIDRLRHEVDALKQEISELNEAQRQAGETIAALREDSRSATPSAYWYSNLAALHFKVVSYAEPRAAVPPPGAPESRDAATSSIQPESRVATPAPRRARREPREPVRRDNVGNGGNGGNAGNDGPLSLEPGQ